AARTPRTTTTAIRVTWTREVAPAWTPRPPEPSVSYSDSGPASLPVGPTPSPSGSPDESGRPGDRPAYRIPAAASLTTSEVPAKLILWEDTGPTLERAEALGTVVLCEDPNTGYERLGSPIISGR